MTSMKKILATLALALVAVGGAHAAKPAVPLDDAPNLVNNMASLQNGARLFTNFCLNCHAANAVRYNRLLDIGLTEDQIRDNLIFSEARVGETMSIAMRPSDAKVWLGKNPPDLGLITKARSTHGGGVWGNDYVYTLMRSYYRDNSTPTGWNNTVLPAIAMPNIFWELQGPREMIRTEMRTNEAGEWERVVTTYGADGYSTTAVEAAPGYRGAAMVSHSFNNLDPAAAAQFDRDIADLTAFLTWMSDPNAATRKRLGVIVLLFLGLFTLVAWRLNAVFWKDIR